MTTPPRIALLGCGTVGREVSAQLLDSESRLGIRLCAILVRDHSRDRGLPRHLFTTSLEDIDAAGPDLVIELIGGLEPAGELVARFLGRGIPVVTANKTLIAHRGRELAALAHERGTHLAYEASVCAAIPVITSLRHLAGDRILSIRGIVNGSCNFILSRLNEGWRMDEALAEARKRGLVEPDPSADISGRDSAEKLCILAGACGIPLLPHQVETRGIESLTPDDLTAARRSSRTIKLLAELELTDGLVRARVGPTLIPRAHTLAGVEDEENGVVIETSLGGELFLKGRGAGPKPTASAVLGDMNHLLHPPSNHRSAKAPTPWGVRTHHIRVAREHLPPSTVLETTRPLLPVAVDLTRSVARIETGPTSSAAADACARTLGGRSLVMSVLDTRPELR